MFVSGRVSRASSIGAESKFASRRRRKSSDNVCNPWMRRHVWKSGRGLPSMTFGNANERAMKKYLCLICLFVCLFVCWLVGWLVGWFCFFVSVIFVLEFYYPLIWEFYCSPIARIRIDKCDKDPNNRGFMNDVPNGRRFFLTAQKEAAGNDRWIKAHPRWVNFMILDPLAIKTFLFDTARLPVYGRRVTPQFFASNFRRAACNFPKKMWGTGMELWEYFC